MQNFFGSAGFTLVIFLFACNSNNQSKHQSYISDSTNDAQSIFPVTQFLLGQLREIDSLPVTPIKITTVNGKSDSVWLKRKDIRPFAAPFLTPVIDSVAMQKFFTEKSFFDQTINAITFSYDPKNDLPDSVHLNHWDVYIDPQKNTVQRIYMVKQEIIDKKNVVTQLTWQVNKWCSIRTITQQIKLEPLIKEEKMEWESDE